MDVKYISNIPSQLKQRVNLIYNRIEFVLGFEAERQITSIVNLKIRLDKLSWYSIATCLLLQRLPLVSENVWENYISLYFKYLQTIYGYLRDMKFLRNRSMKNNDYKLAK